MGEGPRSQDARAAGRGIVASPVVFSPARVLPADVRAALGALLWSRVLVWVAGLAGLGAFGRAAGWERFDPSGLTTPFGPVGDALVAPAARWDAVWFLVVVSGGYQGGARPAFFPLYPGLAGVVGFPVGSELVGALLVSGAAALAALVLVHRLAALELGERYARPAVLVVAFFPTSLFLSAVYSESLFLALSAGAFLAARREAWLAAGLLGALAAATRSIGVALLVPLALLWWEGRRGRDGAWLGLVPLGLAGFCGYLAAVGEDPLAPFAAQEVWFRSFAGPFMGAWDGAVAAFDGARQLLSGSREPVYFERAAGDPFEVARRNLADFAFLGFAVVATAGAWRRLPAAYGAWAVLALAVPLSYPVEPQPLMSMGRFALVLFPLHLWLAAVLVDRGATDRWLAVSGGLLGVLSAQFAAWEFVG